MMSKNRQLMILMTCLILSVAVFADDGLPIVEVRLQPPHRQCTSEWRRKTDSHSDEGQGYRQDSSV